MSDTPQGPGWWVASDGKYYPPQQSTPPPVPPPPAQPAPMYQAQPMYQPVQPMAPGKVKKGGNKGCMIAIIIFVVVVVVLPVIAWFAIANWFNKNVGTFECDVISAKDAEEVFGAQVSLFQTGSLTAPANFTLDDRILTNEKSCQITRLDTATQGQMQSAAVFKVDKADAQAYFQSELAKAKKGTSAAPITTTTTVGPIELPNGETVTMPPFSMPDIGSMGTEEPFFLKDVTLGDEAFCTKATFIDSNGVFVRKGNTLVYATVKTMNTSIDNNMSDSNCDYAIKLATKALG